MLFSSFGHRLLLVFGFVLAATIAVVAAKIGWLGDRPHQLIEDVWGPLQGFYEAQKQVLNPAFWLLAFQVRYLPLFGPYTKAGTTPSASSLIG
jgi:hypothetical protein